MNLSVKEAARLLSVSEKTVYRWIKQEIVPAYRVHAQYRFNRAELLEWATSRRISLPPEAFPEPEVAALPLPSLSEALETGGVFYRIEGRTRDEVLADVVAHLRLPDEVDRSYLLQSLIAREQLASTGVGEGIALPHPRNSALLPVTRATVTLCFPEYPVDFKALDGQPVHALLILVSASLRAHLHLLSRLGFLLRDQDFRRALANRGSREEVFSALRQAEERIPR